MNNYLVERWYPVALGVAVGIGSLWIKEPIRLSIAQDLANPITSILAITIGFVAAALTFLLSATDLSAVRTLRTGTGFNQLVDYHWQAIVSGMIAALLSLCVIVVCKQLATWPQFAVFHLWVASVVWAFSAFFRVVNLLQKLLRL